MEIEPLIHWLHPDDPINIEDHVQLMKSCLYNQKILRNAREFDTTVRVLLFALTGESEAKTRRIEAGGLVAKIELQADTVSQSLVKQSKELLSAETFARFFRVATYAPNLIEVKKLRTSTGDAEFDAVKESVLGCIQPSYSPPRVTIEKVKNK